MKDLIMFKVSCNIDGEYYIAYNIIYMYYTSNIKDITTDLQISKGDFIADLTKFHAYIHYLNYYFHNKTDADDCVEYLNDKYGILKKLTGDY